MTNLDVARAMVCNALAYGRSGDLKTVMHNLELISELLDSPAQDNDDYEWEDFK